MTESHLRVSKLTITLEQISRFFLYVLIFWLPYSGAVVEVCVCVCFVLWLIKCGTGNTSTFREKTFIPFIIFMLLALCSALLSTMKNQSVHGLITKTFEWFVIFYLLIENVKTRKQVYIMLGILLFTGMAVALDAVAQYFFLSEDIFFRRKLINFRATGPFQFANSLAAFLTVLTSMLVSMVFVKKCSRRYRVGLIFVLLIFVVALTVTYSRSAWISVILGSIIGIHLNRPWMTKFILLLLCVTAIGAVYYSNNSYFTSRLNVRKLQKSFEWRVNLWQDTLKMVKHKPVLGHGPNTFMKEFQKYRRKADNKYEYNPSYAHNCYLQMIAEWGILGFGAFCGFVWIVFKEIRGRCIAFKDNVSFDIGVYFGLLAGICAFLIHSASDVNFYSLQLSVYLWYALGLLIAFGRIINYNQLSINKD